MVERSGGLEAGSGTAIEAQKLQLSGCAEHGFEQIRGFCKDCSCGICFRCAISKHRNHNMVNTDEITKSDLDPMIETFDQKL